MNVYELSAQLSVAKGLVESGRESAKRGQYSEAWKQLLGSLEIYRSILREADTSDPKGGNYGKFAYIVARENILKVARVDLKNLQKGHGERKSLVEIISEAEGIKISSEDMYWFYSQSI